MSDGDFLAQYGATDFITALGDNFSSYGWRIANQDDAASSDGDGAAAAADDDDDVDYVDPSLSHRRSKPRPARKHNSRTTSAHSSSEGGIADLGSSDEEEYAAPTDVEELGVPPPPPSDYGGSQISPDEETGRPEGEEGPSDENLGSPKTAHLKELIKAKCDSVLAAQHIKVHSSLYI
jgi:hypothetical protein